MKTLRSRVIALTAASMIVATGPAAAQSLYGPVPPDYRPLLWQGWYAGLHLGYGDAGSVDGFVGGAQIGHNWQNGQLVYGLEADVTWSDMSDSERISVCATAAEDGCVSVRVSASIDWMVTVRGRLGYLFQPGLLAYATAGFGIVDGDSSVSMNVPGFNRRSISVSGTDTDFVYGIGVEGRLTELSTLRVEYLGFSDSEIDIIRAGINFKLGN